MPRKPTLPFDDDTREEGDVEKHSASLTVEQDELLILKEGATLVVENNHSHAPNPFDPATLRLCRDQETQSAVKRVLLTVPVRKPDRSWFVRVHPALEYQLDTKIIELKEERELYLVEPTLWPELEAEGTFSARTFFTALTRQGVLFLWPVRLPGADGKIDEWSRSALEAAEVAKTHWVCVSANMALGGYEVFQAIGQLGEPNWPEIKLGEMLRLAFRDKFINRLDHPVLRRLRGEI